MMLISDVFKIVSDSLGVDLDLIGPDSSSENLEEWDSLGHITILSGLDDFTSGKSADLVDLTQATSVQELIDVLKENNFIDK